MLVDEDPARLNTLSAAYFTVMRVRSQVAILSTGVAASVGLGLTFSTDIVERSPATILSLVMIGLAAGHGSLLILAFSVTIYHISQMDSLRISWSAPVLTPGLVSLSEVLRLGASLGMILYLVMAVPATWLFAHQPEKIKYVGIMAIPVVLIFLVGIVAQTWLARPVRLARYRVMKDMQELIDSQYSSVIGGQEEATQKVHGELQLLATYQGLPSSFLRGETMIQYSASLLAGIAPVLLAWLLATSG
jgi:hypothetical protein